MPRGPDLATGWPETPTQACSANFNIAAKNAIFPYMYICIYIWGRVGSLPVCQLGTERPQRQIRLAKTWSGSKVSRFKGLTQPFWATPPEAAVLVFYAPLCEFKKQFRNCFCNAAPHTAYVFVASSLHTYIFVFVFHISQRAGNKATEPSRAIPNTISQDPIRIPSLQSPSFQRPNNAVVIVVFTSIKSWQLFLPCLPNLAGTTERNELRLPLCRFVWLITELQTVMAAIVLLWLPEFSICHTRMVSRPQVVTAKKWLKKGAPSPNTKCLQTGRNGMVCGWHGTMSCNNLQQTLGDTHPHLQPHDHTPTHPLTHKEGQTLKHVSDVWAERLPCCSRPNALSFRPADPTARNFRER